MNSPHKWTVKRKMLQFDDVIMVSINKVLLKVFIKAHINITEQSNE